MDTRNSCRYLGFEVSRDCIMIGDYEIHIEQIEASGLPEIINMILARNYFQGMNDYSTLLPQGSGAQE